MKSNTVRPRIPSNINIFFTNKNGCSDIYNELIKVKIEPITSLYKCLERGLIFNNKFKSGTKDLNFHLKLLKNQNSNGYNFNLYKIIPKMIFFT